MISKFKIAILLSFFFFVFLTLLPNTTNASEGFTEIRSVDGRTYRCIASGQQMGLKSYRTLVTCRDLIYPSDSVPIKYVMWANPVKEGELIKFGKLDFGKKLFTHARPYNSIFVTVERGDVSKMKKPKGSVVMRGTTQPFTLLEMYTSPTPTPEPTITEPEKTVKDKSKESDKTSTSSRLASGFKRAGAIVAIVLLIGSGAALVVILKSKKR